MNQSNDKPINPNENEKLYEAFELNPESTIVFDETILPDDLYKFNLYLLRHRHSNYYFMGVIALVGVLSLIMGLVNSEYIYVVIGGAGVIYAALLMPIQVFILKRSVKKRFPNGTGIDIHVEVAENGFIYCITDEEPRPISWNVIQKVVSVPGYLYIHFSSMSVAILVKKASERMDDVEDMIEETLGTGNRFIVMKK